MLPKFVAAGVEVVAEVVLGDDLAWHDGFFDDVRVQESDGQAIDRRARAF